MTDENAEQPGILSRFAGWLRGGGRAPDADASDDGDEDVSEATQIDRYKAHVVGEGLRVNALAPDDKAQNVFTEKGAIAPPLPFDALCALLYTSNSLRQNIDAYVVNIESTGWRLEPTIDLWGADAADNVRNLLALQNDGEDPKPDEVESTLKEWKKEAAREKARLTHFFEFAHPEDTFTKLRQKKRRDEELLGNAGWEFVRNAEGDYAIINHVDFVNVRLMPLDKRHEEVEIPYKSDDVTIDTATIWRRHRRYVQIQEGVTVYFKQFGDERVMSAATGTYYKDVEAMRIKEPRAREATEFLHFDVDAPNSAYGMPRWVGNLISVMGSRLSEEVNFLYFENKSVPPLAIIFSGGRISADSVTRLQSFVKNHIRGKGNFHKVLIIEAEPEDGESKNTGRSQIKIEKLMDAQQQDALFQKYDRNNIDKVGSSFRVPGMLRGDIRELNRATADIAERLAEAQVFLPLRDDFDADVNRKLLPRMRIRFWKFQSRSPIKRDPTTITENVSKLVERGVLMPNEARKMLSDIFGRDFLERDDLFLTMPQKLAVAAIRAAGRPEFPADLIPGLGGNGAAEKPSDGQPPQDEQADDEERLRELGLKARDLATLRDLMDSEEVQSAVVKIPSNVLKRILEEDGYEPEIEVAE